MDERGTPDVPSALRAGRIEGISFPDLLWALCRRRTTGVLRIGSTGVEKALYLERGRIVFASSSDPNDRLGELFLREGRVTLDRLEHSLARSQNGKRLGTLLVESGALTADQLVQGVLAQVERIVLSLFAVEEGDYRFEDGPLPTDEVITLGMRTGELLLRGIRQIRSFGRIRRSVGGPHKVYGLAEGWRGLSEGLRLVEGEQQLLDRLRAGDASIETLCRDVYLSNFEIYQTLLGFRVLGLIEPREPKREPIGETSWHGVLGDEGFAELLVRLGRSDETGVLYVTRGTQERTFHVSAGRCVFATSNDPDDGLVAYLLRRGVISLADREETAKRLLSNKRVGTILRELGVIDERDLREMVRRQLSEIVFDTFRWTAADYAFVRGSLPTIEEITLEETLESLVAAGMRRVDSWSRVWSGCGGLEAALELRPSYLSVLDAMQAGADEWQIVAALKVPRTAREICRSSDLGDFRVCQILWTLRLLGAVGTVPAESRAEQERPVVSVSSAPFAMPPAPIVAEVEAAAAELELETVAPIEAPTREPAAHADSDRQLELEPAAPIVAEVEAAAAELETVAPIEAPTREPAAHADSDRQLELEPAAPTVAEVEAAAAELALESGRPIEAPTIEPEAHADLELELATASEIDVPAAVEVAAVPEPEPEDEPMAIEIDRAAVAAVDRASIRIPIDEHDRAPSHGKLETTQLIPREALESALRRVAAPIEDAGPVIEATQSIAPDVLEAAQAKARPEDTGPVSREELARSLGETAAERPWVEPDGFADVLARFNAAHRLVYRTVRSEVGAGASNFLRATCAQRAPAAAWLIEGVTLSPDGSWDTEQLKRAAVDGRVADPWPGYVALLDAEIDRIGEFLGAPRAIDLRRQIEALEAAPAAQA
jgi:hypothetical protein